MAQGKPANLFYSYSHKDAPLRAELDLHLALLKRQGLLATWFDGQMTAGAEWSSEIERNLEDADVVLLLVSADFLASDFCWGVELKRALQRHESGDAKVIPVILRPCDWKSAPFGKLQALPESSQPVTQWRSSDEAWLSVAQGLRKALSALPPNMVSAEPSVPVAGVMSGDTPSSCTINVCRKWQIMGSPLSVVVKCDGVSRGILSTGASCQFFVTPGSHVIQAFSHNEEHNFQSEPFQSEFEAGAARWFSCSFPRGRDLLEDVKLSFIKKSIRKLSLIEISSPTGKVPE